MWFQHPSFKWAFLLLLIPIIIHLFQFRRYKTIEFPGVFRLKQQLQSSKKQKNVKNWWILISRILAFFFFFLSFLVPSCQENKVINASNKFAIIVDCSPSMGLLNSKGIILEQAKQRAKLWIQQQPSQSQFAVIAHHGFSVQEWLDSRQALDRIDAITLSNWPENFTQWSAQLSGLRAENGLVQVSIFTDAKEDVFEGIKLVDFTDFKLNVVRFESSNKLNFSIDSAWSSSVLASNTTEREIQCKIKVSDPEFEGEVPVQIKSDSKVLGTALAKFAKNKYTQITFTIPQNSGNQITINLQDESLQADNSLYLHFPGYSSKTIYLEKTQSPIDRIISIQSVFEKRSNLQEAETWVYPELNNMNSEKWDQIKQQVEKGKNVVLFVTKGDVSSLKNMGIQGNWSNKEFRIFPQELNNDFFTSAFSEKVSPATLLPVISEHFEMESSEGQNWQTELTLENGSPILLKQDVGNGALWVWLSDLNSGSTKFMKSSWCLPIFTQIFMGKPLSTKPICGFLNGSEPIYYDDNLKFDNEKQLVLEMNGVQWVMQSSMGDFGKGIDAHFPAEKPGFYNLFQGTKNTNNQILSINSKRDEANLSDLNSEQMSQIQKLGITFVNGETAGGLFKLNQELNNSWRLFLCLSALFFAIEWILLYLKFNRSKSTLINES